MSDSLILRDTEPVFTGIVERKAAVALVQPNRLEIQPPKVPWDDQLKIGESIAVNGCCLTLVPGSESHLSFDLSEETLRRTNLGEYLPGDLVNLERAMRADGRFGGHIVQGHVDAVGSVTKVARSGGDDAAGLAVTFAAPAAYAPYLIDKGSIAINGVSLTVVKPSLAGDSIEFEVWLIPHTISETALPLDRIGAKVNLEFDVIAKYVFAQTAASRMAAAGTAH